MARNSSAKVVNYNNPSSATRGSMQKARRSTSTSGSKTNSSSDKINVNNTVIRNYRDSLQNFVNAYRDAAEVQQLRDQALKTIAEINDQYGDYKAPESVGMSQGLKNTMNDTNTLLGAIRDGIFSARGINSMLAQQRRDQVMQILNGKNPTTPTATTNTPAATGETSAEDVVEYTYKPGDTFGQVIKDLGLQTDNGLWGPNGDVAYYTQQLQAQGLNGNIKPGTIIRLTRRK